MKQENKTKEQEEYDLKQKDEKKIEKEARI